MSDVKDNIREYERRVKLMAAKGSASCDYPLPDYLGDVKKILKYSAEVVPTDKYLGTKDASFLYQICFKVVYLDSEDVLTEARFSADFEHSERLERECIDASADAKAESVSIRLQGPRKICAKAQMTTEVYIIEALPLPTLVYNDTIEKDLCYANIYSVEYLECAEREFAERIAALADISCEDAEVIKEGAAAYVESVVSEGGGICVKGYVVGTALIRSEDGVIRAEKKIPFEENLSTDRILEGNASYHAKAFVTDAKITLNNEMGEDGLGDGCYCSVVLSYSVKCLIRINKNCEYELVKDAFAPGKLNSGEYVEFTYDELIAEVNEKRKSACEIERPTGPIREIIECEAELKGLRVAAQGEEITVSADVCYSGIVSLADGSGFAPVKHTAKAEERMKLPALAGDCRIECSAIPSEVSMSFDNERLYFSTVISVNAVALKEHKDKIMTGLVTEDGKAESTPTVTVYET